MELAFLVYIVENLTYNGSFWATLSGWSFVLFIAGMLSNYGIKFYNSLQKDITRVIYPEIKVGNYISLKSDHGDLKAGNKYQIEILYEGLREVKFKGSQAYYKLDSVRSLLVGQEETTTKSTLTFKVPKVSLLLVLSIVFMLLDTLLPTRQTAIYIVGAYLVQEVVTSDAAKEVGNKAQKVVLRQLDKWADEVPELKDMVEGVVVVKENTVNES